VLSSATAALPLRAMSIMLAKHYNVGPQRVSACVLVVNVSAFPASSRDRMVVTGCSLTLFSQIRAAQRPAPAARGPMAR